VDTYPVLAGGDCVHGSDVLAHAIEDLLGAGSGSPTRLLDAACDCYGLYPREIAGICLHAAYPDAIVAVRHNKPLELGRAADGSMWLASSVAAFGEHVEPLLAVPSETGLLIGRDGSIRTQPVRGDLLPVGPRLSAARAYSEVARAVREAGSCSVVDLLDAAGEWWPRGILPQKETVVFGALAELRADGKIDLWDERTTAGGATGTRTWTKWAAER